MRKMKISGEDILKIVLKDSALETQLNDINWEAIDPSLLGGVLALGGEIIASGSQSS